ncbi:hypothetical protein ABIB82_005641 [Bradyrhizobium sp. i1.8.4]
MPFPLVDVSLLAPVPTALASAYRRRLPFGLMARADARGSLANLGTRKPLLTPDRIATAPAKALNVRK